MRGNLKILCDCTSEVAPYVNHEMPQSHRTTNYSLLVLLIGIMLLNKHNYNNLLTFSSGFFLLHMAGNRAQLHPQEPPLSSCIIAD